MPPILDLKHLVIPPSTLKVDFAPVTGHPNAPRPTLTARQQRYLHATKLENDLSAAADARALSLQSIEGLDSTVVPGLSLEIEGATVNQLKAEKLEDRRGNYPIELLNVKIDGDHVSATIFVPQPRLESLKRRIKKYGDPTEDTDGTKGSTILIDSVEAIKLADLASFWIPDTPLSSDLSQVRTWEVWLRKGSHAVIKQNAAKFGISISGHKISFQECEICLITGSQEKLALLQLALMPLIGLTYREETPDFFEGLTPVEQAEWMDSLLPRVRHADITAPAVCVLDTGVHAAHPLLRPAIADTDRDACNPAWGKEDHSGHGTKVAGIALFEDLSPLLAGADSVELKHRLESVKILPPRGTNPEEHYGWITQEAVSRSQINAPSRGRVFCLAVTASGNSTSGRPSAWSSSIDKICFGLDDELNINDANKQLFVISGGNIRDNLSPQSYPDLNMVECIENPGQSWNALTIGAITHKTFPNDPSVSDWNLLGVPGGLSPTSRTSVAWTEKDWPIKPDLVLEGGNCIHDGSFVSDHADLSLLSTGHDVPFRCMSETSAAASLAARMAAIIKAEYPAFWPETIRGLLVHSAWWTDAMTARRSVRTLNVTEKENLLRTFGYGEPNLALAQFSASNRACLIIQDELQPFRKTDDQAEPAYGEMKLHKLPWPESFLHENSALKIRLRASLSYFIEPSPSRRIPARQYSYASHQLKFDLQRPLETEEKFRERINKRERVAGQEFQAADTSNKWLLGVNSRNKGSLVSDVWEGTAGQLASQQHIAVMPEGGWWKTRKHLNRYNEKARYALILSLEFESADIDVYTKIKNEIEIASSVPITIS